ncbi:hypothetical protein C211_03735 [Stutzerimonas degradans]|nr:hypothetical protein C211_03735 [Stutzerimonas degradans]
MELLRDVQGSATLAAPTCYSVDGDQAIAAALATHDESAVGVVDSRPNAYALRWASAVAKRRACWHFFLS